MKNILLVIVLLTSNYLFSQNQIEIIKIKNKDNSVSISAKNRSITAYEVNIDITLIGMVADKEFPLSFTLNPNQTESIVTIIPIADSKERNYKIHYRAEPQDRTNDQLVYDVIEPNITIYTKNNHSGSTYINKYFKKNAIPFYEINIEYNKENMRRFEDMVARRGLKDKEIKYPVVIYRGEIHYDIKDIVEFCEKNFKNRTKI